MLKFIIAIALICVAGCDKGKDSIEAAPNGSGSAENGAVLTVVEAKVGKPVGIRVGPAALENVFETKEGQRICDTEFFANGSFAVITADVCVNYHENQWTLHASDGSELARFHRLVSRSPSRSSIFVNGANDEHRVRGAVIDLDTGDVWAPADAKVDDRFGIHFVEGSEEMVVWRDMGIRHEGGRFGYVVVDELPERLPETVVFSDIRPRGDAKWDATRDGYTFSPSSQCLEAILVPGDKEVKCILEVPTRLQGGRDSFTTPDWHLIEPRDGDPSLAFERRTGKQFHPSAGECSESLTVLPRRDATAPAMLLGCGRHYGAMEEMQLWTPAGQFELPDDITAFHSVEGNFFELTERGVRGLVGERKFWLDFDRAKLVEVTGYNMRGDRVASDKRFEVGLHTLSLYDPATHTFQELAKMECATEVEATWHSDDLMSVTCVDRRECGSNGGTIVWDFRSKKAYRTSEVVWGSSESHIYYGTQAKNGEQCDLKGLRRTNR